MLFSGSSSSTKPKRDDKRERKADKEEHNEVQEAVFTRWANSLFETESITELRDIVDLDFLQSFAKLITGQKAPVTTNFYDNIDSVFHLLSTDDNDKILSLSIPELCKGDYKSLSTLCWQFAQIYWKRFAPQGTGEKKMSEAIKEWCLEATSSHVNDFTSSWRDGMALNLLLHSYDESLVNVNKIREMRGEERIENALSIAKKIFKVPKLIQTKEFSSGNLDTRSVVLYLATLYIAMAYHSSSLSSSSKKSTRSNPESEQLTEEFQQAKQRLEPPAAQYQVSAIDDFNGSPNTSTISIQSSTHSSAPSSSTTTTVIHGGGNDDASIHQEPSSETLSDNPELEDPIPSRRSSSSSARSSRSRRSAHRNERLLKEYELCLEQVLTWLLEAKDEMDRMEPVNETDVDVVKQQFKEHEQFMLQLTNSQGSVGRVLHAGQNLSQKLSGDTAQSINNQLIVVNGRWETVREQATLRQHALQEQLNRLQREQLQSIGQWLDQIDAQIENDSPLSDDIEKCRQQTSDHAELQEKIEAEQPSIQKLSTFMAVVDEQSTDTEQAYSELESLLQAVGKRWVQICEWAERRAQNLDGLVELLENYTTLHRHLSAWLSARQEELGRLRSDRLDSEEELNEQKRLVNEMDAVLESEHPSFVQLSQFCNELVRRFDGENKVVAEKIRKELDAITQSWENIVSRLEEQSQTLARNQKEPSAKSSTGSTHPPSAQPSFDTNSAASDPPEASRSKKHSDETAGLVERFINEVRQLETDIGPVHEFVSNFKVPTKTEFPAVEKEFKEKFEIVLKTKPRVEHLNETMGRIHETSVDSETLHAVNENYDRFMETYGRIVGRFTEIIHFINNPQLANDETAKMENRLGEWLRSANALWNELSRLGPDERGRRLDDFADQLFKQQKNFADIKQNHPNVERFRPLESQLIELIQKVRRERKREAEYFEEKRKTSNPDDAHESTPRPSISDENKPKLSEPAKVIRQHALEAESSGTDTRPAAENLRAWLAVQENEIRNVDTTPGDVELLKRVAETCNRLIDEMTGKQAELEGEEERQALEQLIKTTETKRDAANESLRQTENVIHKLVRAEEIADGHRRKFEYLSNTTLDLASLQKAATKLQDEFLNSISTKIEALTHLSNLLAAKTKDPNKSRDPVVQQLCDRGSNLKDQWTTLEDEIENFRSVIDRDNRTRVQTLLREQTTAVDELKAAIVASGEATDAEELSEHVDNMERLLDQVEHGRKTSEDETEDDKQVDPLHNVQGAVADPLLASELERLKTKRAQVVEAARNRCSRLHDAISRCEQFDSALCNFQSWAQHMHHILHARLADDITALDVPHEYKQAYASGTLIAQMDGEFTGYEKLMIELSEFIEDSKSQWASCDRLKLQLNHANQQLAELRTKFEAFKHPIQFSKELERVEREFTQIEDSMDDLTSIRAENCEYCLQHAQQMIKQLNDADIELVNLESKKDGLIQAGIFNEQQAIETSKRLENAQERCTQLVARAEVVIENLAHCLELLKKLETEMSTAKQSLRNVEELLPSDSSNLSQTQPPLFDQLSALINQGSGSIQKAIEFQQLLRQNSVKTEERALETVEQKLSALRRQLGVKQSSEGKTDEEDAEKLFEKLQSVVEKMERTKSLQSLQDALRKYSPLKQQMDANVITQLEHNQMPNDTRARFGPIAADIAARWSKLERKVKDANLKSPNENPDDGQSSRVPPALSHVNEELRDGKFAERVSHWLNALKNANSNLDFLEHPLPDIAVWERRLDTVERWFTEAREPLDELLNEGKRLADTGRMELELHDAIEELDRVMDLSAKISFNLQHERALYAQTVEFDRLLRKNCTEIEHDLNLIEQQIPNTSNEIILENKNRLMEAENRLQVLTHSTDELKQKLPGRECALSGSTTLLNEIRKRMRDIEDAVQQALIDALNRNDTLEEQLTDDEIQRNKRLRPPVHPDGVSMSSGAGLSLAMDVQETSEGEGDESPVEINVPRSTGSLEQLYTLLDDYEDRIEAPEKLKYEGLAEKMRDLEIMEKKLTTGEDLVRKHAMTMDTLESEHTLNRIANLLKLIDDRKQEIAIRANALNSLSTLFNQAEESVAKVGRFLEQQNRVRDSQSRERSPELEELEASQLEAENLLPPTAVLLQQCDNRLQTMNEQLSTADVEILNQRLRDMDADFRVYSSDVREKRRTLEERLADYGHLTNQLDLLVFWYRRVKCDEVETTILNSRVSFLDPNGLNSTLERIRNGLTDVEEKCETFRNLETLKDRFVALSNVDANIKHEVRRNVTQLGKRISDLHLQMTQKLKEMADNKTESDEFWNRVKAEEQWLSEVEQQTQGALDATLFRPLNLESLASDASERRFLIDSLQRQVAEESLEIEHTDAHKASIRRVKQLAKRFETSIARLREVLQKTKTEQQDEKNSEKHQDERVAYEPITQPETSIRNDDLSTEYETLTTRDGSVPSAYGEASGEVLQRKSTLNAEIPHDVLATGLNERYAGATTDNEDDPNRPLQRRANSEEQTRLETVVRLRARLQEVERDAAATVDLADQTQIRQTTGKVQNFIDEMNTHRLEIDRIKDQSDDRLIVQRAELCLNEMDRLLVMCQRRKAELGELLHQSRQWDQQRSEVELWLSEGNERLVSGERLNEMDEPRLQLEHRAINGLVDGLEQTKQQIAALNGQSNHLLDLYSRDDGHTLSHVTSKINTQWTKFNDSVRIRRAMIEALLKARSDIQSTLQQLNEWLDKQLVEMRQLNDETDNRQRLKDTTKRRDWMVQEREIQAEIEAHRDVVNSVREMCRKLLLGLEASNERAEIQQNLETMESKWNELNHLDNTARERLENAQEECERLQRELAELLHWTDMQISTILNDQPVGGNLDLVQRQSDTVKDIEKQCEVKDREVSEIIALSQSFLMQHDLRPVMNRQSVLEPMETLQKSQAELEERRVGVQILADSERLKSTYETLKQHVAAWQRVVKGAHRDIQELDRAIAESILALGTIENELETKCPVEDLRLEELKDARTDNAQLKKRVQDAGVHIDDVNDCTGQIAAQNIVLSNGVQSQIHTVNQRYEKLKKEVAIRGAALERAFNDFGPSSEHFLMQSVSPPWQRAISAVNQLPYYVDHLQNKTQWDHPGLISILEHLCSFNQVKFSAYRTAMKLRALQKHMLLDLISLSDVDDTLQRFHGFKLDARIRIEDAVMALVPLFEGVHERHPNLFTNVPFAVDLTLNLLLNIYDPCRDGKMRTISFAIALVVLCNATLESKYKYLFSLIAGEEGVTDRRLGVLFYDLIHIPKFLGEAAVFGGSNVEPSVRSCFEFNRYPTRLSIDGYLDWLRKEPQNLIWLPVMHRLQSSEFAKHQSKCSTCKMFPIVGLRYRCLRCFNFDICQSCFFSQRTAKSHKLTHPMQEYCTPTNAMDDVRDFTLIVKNKVRRARSKIGYLPVETVDEGVPLERGQTAPQNPNSDTIHHRMHLFANRLQQRNQEMGNARKDDEKTVTIVGHQTPTPPRKSVEHDRQRSSDVKSPAQLISQVEQMHKEELDQLLAKLQHENGELKQAVDRKRRLGSTPNLDGGRLPIMRQSTGVGMNGTSFRQRQQPGLYASTQTMPHFAGSKPSLFGSRISGPGPEDTLERPWGARHISQPALHSENGMRPFDRSFPSLPRGFSEMEALAKDQRHLLDHQSLRLHQKHLEERSKVLEDQNRQLQMQLERLQKMVRKPDSTGMLNLSSTPVEPRIGGGWTLPRGRSDLMEMPVSSTDEDEIPGGIEGLKQRKNRMEALISTVNELNRAVESFVVSVVHEDNRDHLYEDQEEVENENLLNGS
ncbi:Discontinuous actin hexagon [Aphelenchoides besseyi]|nr:Discontinuous actin hexagon [Aphelenchoides besseyi]